MLNGYNGWSKSLTSQREGYYDILEITEPLPMDTFNVNILFSNGSITNLSGNPHNYTKFNGTNSTIINSSSPFFLIIIVVILILMAIIVE